MKNKRLEWIESLSSKETTIEPYDYTCMIHLSYSQLIPNSGKTRLAISQGV